MSSFTNSVETLFNKMEGVLSSKTVVGEPIHIGEVIIVPLVDISIGVGAGSRDMETKDEAGKETTGGGLGARMSPSAMLVIQNGSVQLVDVKSKNSINKLIDMVPSVMSKLDLSSFFKKDDNADENTDE